jgi:hypothetical protein
MAVLAGASATAATGLALSATDPLRVDFALTATQVTAGIAAVGLPALGASFWLHSRRPLHAPTVLRWSFAALVAGWIGYLVAYGQYQGHWLALCGAATAGALGILLCVVRPRTPPAGWRRRLELLACGLAAALLLAELALEALALVFPSPLLSRIDADVGRRLQAHAYAPGELRLGVRCNRRGFYDQEFLPRAQRSRRMVAVIGDSFSASYVPLPFHYTTVAEQTLRDVDVYNFGWAALGPAEYLHLLRTEVLPLEPDAIVVALFLGNDLLELRPLGPLRRLNGWFDRSNVLLFELPRRLLRLRGAPRNWQGNGGHELADERAMHAAYPWLGDPLREPGTFGAEEFLAIECDRARQDCTPHRERLELLLAMLRELRAAAGSIPFAFALIPDEFMVEDALWQQIEAALLHLQLERLRLHGELGLYCRAERIPVLDFLPVLLGEPPLAGDSRHLYLLRDTHWNVRGNAVAGRALAAFVSTLLR